MKKFLKFLKWLMYIIIFLIFLVLVLAFVGNYIFKSTVNMDLPDSDHLNSDKEKFFNPFTQVSSVPTEVVKTSSEGFWRNKNEVVPKWDIPTQKVLQEDLERLGDEGVYAVKIGHSSFLLKIYEEYWLLDPHFSERASPLGFVGPKRYTDLPIELENLPPIKRVLISHNHYDHLDKATLVALKDKAEAFYVPLGVDGDLLKWGIDDQKVKAFEWWQEESQDNGLVAFVPTKHFSGRGLSDQNKTLWGSWVIKAKDTSLYFSGDSGYFDGFQKIGEKYGPFDITFIENGAYSPSWSDVHMFPEESVQAHLDLNGKIMIPIHNGTFNLSFHAWNDPLIRVTEAAQKKGVSISIPKVGEIFEIGGEILNEKWWIKN